MVYLNTAVVRLVLVCMLGCDSPSKRQSAAVRRVGLKDVLKVMNDVTSTSSRLVSSTSSSSSSSSATVVLPLQQTVAVCTLLLMTDDSRQSGRVVNSEVTLGKVSLHSLYLTCTRSLPM